MIVLIGMALAVSRPAVAEDKTGSDMDAMEVIADLTLIDGACRDVVVSFGAGFAFAASHGVPEDTIMPTGRRRAEFESVLRSRQASFGTEELCGQIAKNYMEALPSSVVPVYRHADARP